MRAVTAEIAAMIRKTARHPPKTTKMHSRLPQMPRLLHKTNWPGHRPAAGALAETGAVCTPPLAIAKCMQNCEAIDAVWPRRFPIEHARVEQGTYCACQKQHKLSATGSIARS
jgi:hypothetical protein